MSVSLHRSARLLPLLVLAAAGCCSALAGTVEVFVHDENGAPVIDERVTLHPPGAGARINSPFGNAQTWQAHTNSSGVALFLGLPPGPYTATILPRTLGLVPPEENPLAPVPTVTLENDQDRARLEIELWHGTPVVERVALHRGRLQTARVIAREIDHGLSLQHSLRVDRDDEQILAPGRWELQLDPPPGYLLIDVEIDGRPVAGHVASVELNSFGSPSFVTWHVTAPASITGQVYFTGEKVGVSVVARLLEPGPWFEAVNQRGGSRFQVIEATPDVRGEYLLELPDGRWELSVAGSGVVEVEPERAELVVPPGAELRQDFKVTAEREEGGGMILVEVEDPDGARVVGATVEVWPENPAQRGEEPVARETTERWGAFIRDLPAGSYIIAAGHPRFVEGRFSLAGYDPEEKAKRVRPVVVLQRAGKLHAVASDAADKAVEGARLVMTRISEKPPTLIAEESLAAAVLEARGETDATGHAWIEGIWPGTYALRGDLSGSGGAGSFVRFAEGNDSREALEITFFQSEERIVQVEILPAASFTARLICTDEYPLPRSVSFAALPGWIDPLELGEEGWMKHAALRVDDVPLTGNPRERLLAGPLEDDAYYLAVRPTGHQRWTWAMSTERLADAAMLGAGRGDPVELGTQELHCGPAVRLVPSGRDGQELPDLESVTPDHGRLTLSGTVTKSGESRPVDRFEVETYPDELILRGLPEGDADLELTLSHPYFLPPVIRVPIGATLERGKTERTPFVIPAVGGAIRIESDRGAAGRLTGAAGEPKIEPAGQGQVLFENLPPGRYRVELCEDEVCATVLRAWENVQAAPLRTVELNGE